MLFNSVEFLLFLPIIFILYWFVLNKNLKLQNLLVLLSSYVFYGWWITDFYDGMHLNPNGTIKLLSVN